MQQSYGLPRSKSPARKIHHVPAHTDERSAAEDEELRPARREAGYHGRICFITDALLRKVSGEADLKRVRMLNLHLGKDEGKIATIQHLEACVNVEHLNLSYNIVSQIQGLESLTRLKDLNLAENNISRLEGLSNLLQLEQLNVSGNRITRIPKSIGKLQCLRVLRMARNKLNTVKDLEHLMPLRALTAVSIHDNPIADHPHTRLFVIFCVRSLEMCDGLAVSADERRHAAERFENAVVDELNQKLSAEKARIASLQAQVQDVSRHAQQAETAKRTIETQFSRENQSHMHTEAERQAMMQLLDLKTEEVARLTKLLADAEQKLAFYQIDEQPGVSRSHHPIEGSASFIQLGLSPIGQRGNESLSSASKQEQSVMVPREALEQERRGTAKQLRDLNSRLEALTSRLRDSELKRESLEQQLQAAVAQEEDNAALRKALRDAEDAHQRTVASLQAEIERVRANNVPYTTLEQLRADNERLRTQLAESHDELTRQRQKTETELRALKAQTDRQAAEATALADLESVIQDYRDKLAKKDAKTSELHGELVKLKELLQIKEQQLNGIRESYEEQLRDLQREMRQLHTRQRLKHYRAPRARGSNKNDDWEEDDGGDGDANDSDEDRARPACRSPERLVQSSINEIAIGALANVLLEELLDKVSGIGDAIPPTMESPLKRACIRAAMRVLHTAVSSSSEPESDSSQLDIAAWEAVSSAKHLQALSAKALKAVEAQQNYDSLKAEIELLRTEAEKLQQRIVHDTAVVAEKESQVKHLQTTAETARQNVAQAALEMDRVKAQLGASEQTLREMAAEKSRLHTELADARTALSNLQRELSSAKFAAQRGNAELAEIKTEVSKWEDILADIKRRAAGEQDSLGNVRRQTDEQVKHAQRTLSDLRNECKFESDRLSAIRAERKQLEEHHRSLVSKHDQEVSAAHEQLADINRQIAASKLELKAAESSTENAGHDKRRLESELAHLRESWQREVAQWERRVTDLKSTSSAFEKEASEFERKATALRDRVLALEMEESRLRQRVEDLQSAVVNAEQDSRSRQHSADQELLRAKDQTEAALRAARQAVAIAETKRSEAEREAAVMALASRRAEEVARQLQDQENALAAARNETVRAAAERDALLREIQTLKLNSEELKRSAAAMRSTMETQQREQEESRRKQARLEDEEASVRATLERLRVASEELKLQNEQLRHELEQTRLTMEKDRREHNALRDKKSMLEAELSRLEEERKFAQEQISTAIARYEEATAAVTKSREEHVRVQKEILDCKRQITDQEHMLESRRQAARELQQEIEGLKLNAAALSSALHVEREEGTSIRAERVALEQQLSRVRVELQTNQQALRELQVVVERLRQERSEMEKERDNARSEVERLHDQAHAAAVQYETMQSRYKEVEEQLRALRRHIQLEQSIYEQTKQWNDERAESLEQQQDLLRQTSTRLYTMEKSLASANQDLFQQRADAFTEISKLQAARQAELDSLARTKGGGSPWRVGGEHATEATSPPRTTHVDRKTTGFSSPNSVAQTIPGHPFTNTTTTFAEPVWEELPRRRDKISTSQQSGSSSSSGPSSPLLPRLEQDVGVRKDKELEELERRVRVILGEEI